MQVAYHSDKCKSCKNKVVFAIETVYGSGIVGYIQSQQSGYVLKKRGVQGNISMISVYVTKLIRHEIHMCCQ